MDDIELKTLRNIKLGKELRILRPSKNNYGDKTLAMLARDAAKQDVAPVALEHFYRAHLEKFPAAAMTPAELDAFKELRKKQITYKMVEHLDPYQKNAASNGADIPKAVPQDLAKLTPAQKLEKANREIAAKRAAETKKKRDDGDGST